MLGFVIIATSPPDPPKKPPESTLAKLPSHLVDKTNVLLFLQDDLLACPLKASVLSRSRFVTVGSWEVLWEGDLGDLLEYQNPKTNSSVSTNTVSFRECSCSSCSMLSLEKVLICVQNSVVLHKWCCASLLQLCRLS